MKRISKKQRNTEWLASLTYDEFERWCNKGMKGKGFKAYTVSNGQTSRKWRFMKVIWW